jgi:hypothetical protein
MSENTSTEAVLPIGGPDGATTDMRRSFRSGGSSAISDATAIGMLEDCMRFLWQIVRITSEVVASVDVGSYRKIAAADCAAPGTVIGADGKAFKAEPAPEGGSKPRGARHPLMVLVGMGTTAVRLLRQLVRGLHPGAVNELAQLDKYDEQLRLIQARGDAKLFR